MLDPEEDIEAFLEEANQHVSAICVLPEHVKMTRSNYAGVACATGGFPNGTTFTREFPRLNRPLRTGRMKLTSSWISMR